MSVLIVYATVEGQTERIARFVRKEIRSAGLEASLADIGRAGPPLALQTAEAVVLAAPVHERRHPPAFESFVAENSEALNARKTLFLSVSLNAAFAEGLEEAGEYVAEMKLRTGFSPTRELLVAGAVRSRSYDYFTSMVLKHVVLRGHGYDPDGGEHEFTDWEAVATATRAFLNASGCA